MKDYIFDTMLEEYYPDHGKGTGLPSIIRDGEKALITHFIIENNKEGYIVLNPTIHMSAQHPGHFVRGYGCKVEIEEAKSIGVLHNNL